MLGLALASISALGRRNRIVIVFDVTQHVCHALPKTAGLTADFVCLRRYRTSR